MIFKIIYMHTLSFSLFNNFNVYLCLGCSHGVMVLWTTGALPKTSKQYWCSSPHCNGQGEHKEHSRVESSQKQTLWLTPISPNIHEQNKVMFIHILFGTHLPMDLPIIQLTLFWILPSDRQRGAWWLSATTGLTKQRMVPPMGPWAHNQSSTSYVTNKGFKATRYHWLIYKSYGKPLKREIQWGEIRGLRHWFVWTQIPPNPLPDDRVLHYIGEGNIYG